MRSLPATSASAAAEALPPPDRVALGFARVLRGAGLAVSVASLLEFVRALRLLGLSAPSGLYWAGRATLISRPEDLALRPLFLGLSRDAEGELGSPILEEVRERAFAAGDPDSPPPDGGAPQRPALASYSAHELLVTRDFATLSDQERTEAAALLAQIRFVRSARVTHRVASSRHRSARPDLRRAVRDAVRLDGEVRIDRYLERRVSPRRLVLLLDVSGSMEPYSREGCLRFAQVAVISRRPVEAFTLGTRLTRVTRYLVGADADRALKASVAAIPDLSGGTRLGESLASFNSEFGVRGVARGATVVICSDGIDRGDPEQLVAELERLRRVAHRVIWVNPLKASPGYAPLARGMAAALGHIDRFLPGHSVEALADLAAAIG